MTLTVRHPLMTEEEKQSAFQTLSSHNWERCVTLTTKRNHELSEVVEFLKHFIRRIDGMNQKSSLYWLGLSGEEFDRFDKENTKNGITRRLHVHGVMANVEQLTNDDISKCWRSVPVIRRHRSDDIEITFTNRLGFDKVVWYNQNPDWLWYTLHQTRRGEIFTNVGEDRE